MSLKSRILLSTLLLGFVLGLGSLTETGYRAEAFALDHWFSLRYQLFGSTDIDPKIVLVGVDEPTVHEIGKPFLLWQSELAGLIGKIKESEPAAVGLDMIIAPNVSDLAPDDPLNLRLQEEAFELGMQAMDSIPVVFAESYSDDIVYQNDQGKEHLVSPHEALVDLLADEQGNTPNLAFVNQPTDPDGLIRRSKLYYHVDSQNKRKIANFALRLLEYASLEKLSFTPGDPPGLSWKDRQVPFLFQESFLINFPGPTENPGEEGESLTFPIISGAKVLNGQVEPGFFKDKIVIIAPTAASMHDEKVVPGDPQYHGGAVHATILNMFLTDSFLGRNEVAWVVLTIFFAWLGWAIGRKGLLLRGTLGAAFVLAFPFAAFTWFGQWLPAVFPIMAYSSASFLGYLERLLTIERDRRRVRSTFARMVSPQVMNHVLDNYRSLKSGQRKEITVLFSDINDFTPTCEQHTPEEVIQMLSEYFSLMVDVIMKYDGYLKQYVGDEIMVIYGAPDDSKDHATRAVLTALEMRDVLAKARETSGQKPGFFDVKIGLNTGSVVVGKVGPESRWEYAAVGDNVNLGARVMSVAKKRGMDIGVSEATRQRFVKETEAQASSFTDKVKWTSQGVQSFKGKISQMEMFGIERE
jgi:class 3 adenylate cyclase/CHASE2 domain-containing sensor protein